MGDKVLNLELLGINKGKITQFSNKGINSIEDLLKFKPRKYYDFRNPLPFKKAIDGDYCSVVGTVVEVKDSKGFIRIKIKEDNKYYYKPSYMYIIFFNQDYIKKLIKVGKEYIFCGKINIKKEYGNMVQMTNPLEFSPYINNLKKIRPIYSKINGMSDNFLLKSINSALALVDKDDYLEAQLLRKFNLVPFNVAIRSIHQPNDSKDIEKAQHRFLFDDLFTFNMHLIANSDNTVTSPFVMKKFNKAKEFMDRLPFDLTEEQRTALRSISIRMKRGERVNALVQGDVGCGKTMVAMLLMIVAGNNGYQSALMAPTNVLAKQHYKELKEKVEPLGFNVAFLSGELKMRERRKVIKDIKEGNVDMIVGTHAIVSKDVEFKSLAIAVIDEEHRFGVLQREALNGKAGKGVHTVTMSATPIPRSLALTIYGESIDVITIKSLPKGRQPVETLLIDNEVNVYEKIYEEIKKGRQCYIVCPLIEDSDSETLEGVDSVETTYSKINKYFKDKNVKVTMISGKMKQTEIAEEIEKFTNKEYDIIISTTIIEVGVNVPNSTVILIKNAERFGLAQLHQLRGRVGRGSHQSYCLLLSNNMTDSAKKKLQVMTQTTDGFIIAKKDLEIRGTGDFVGTSQSGNNKYLMLVMANEELNNKIKQEVKIIFKNKARFYKYKHILNVDISDK